jgi:hypothetical protein
VTGSGQAEQEDATLSHLAAARTAFAELLKEPPSFDWNTALKNAQADAPKELQHVQNMYKKPKQQLKHVSTYINGLLHHNNAIFLPQALRQRCFEEMHDAPYAGHRGVSKTTQAITSLYWWPSMSRDIARYVKTCITCQRSKAVCRQPGGSLQPLPVPTDRWSEVTMDFITGLPCTPRGYDAVLVFYNNHSL